MFGGYTDYIPDMTERFPEGPRGIDMCSDRFDPYDSYDSIDDEDLPEPEPKKLEIGETIEDIEFDGAITEYTIIKFNKERTKAYVTETWFNVDGSGKRKPSWKEIAILSDGKEILVL